MKIKRIPTNEVIIEVTPKNAGNYGFFSISGQERSAESEYRLAQEIEGNIKRHVDDVQYTHVIQKAVYQDENGDNHDSIYDLLASNFSGWSGYSYRYERPSDNGIGTRSSTDSFPELIEEAYRYPHKFEVTGELTEDQKEFLGKAIGAGLAKANGK